jgi:hypothetical protein
MRTEKHNKTSTPLLHFRISLRIMRVSGLCVYPTASSQAHVIGSNIFSKTIFCRQIHLNHKLFKPITVTPTCLIAINRE